MFGAHCMKSWSNSQGIVALPSGEAEYYGMVKGASQGFGMKAVLDDMGVNTKVVIKTDASAAKGIASRKGLRKVRHMRVQQLWLQCAVARRWRKVEKNLSSCVSRCCVSASQLGWKVGLLRLWFLPEVAGRRPASPCLLPVRAVEAKRE